MQSAETVPPGESSAYFGMAAQSLILPKTSAPSEDISSVGANGLFFYEFGGRLGVTEDADIGARIVLEPGPPSYTADVKFQLVRTTNFSLSTGWGMSYLGLSVPIEDQSTNLSLIEANAPIYATFRLTKYADLGMTPRMIYRVTGYGSDYGMLGGTIGLYFGKKIRVGIEGSVFQNQANHALVRHATLGLIFRYPQLKQTSKKGRF